MNDQPQRITRLRTEDHKRPDTLYLCGTGARSHDVASIGCDKIRVGTIIRRCDFQYIRSLPRGVTRTEDICAWKVDVCFLIEVDAKEPLDTIDGAFVLIERFE